MDNVQNLISYILFYVSFRTDGQPEEPFVLFRITFMYYTIIGFAIMFIVGMIVSLLTEAPNIEELNPTLFTPIVRKYVLRKKEKYEMKIIDGKKVLYMSPSE
jgi:hypothetical protein